MGPPHERFHTYDRSTGQGDDRLVHEVELAQRDGGAQIALQLYSLRHFVAHGLVKHGHLVPARFLGLVHGGVSITNESFGRGMRIVPRCESEANTRGDVELDAVQDKWILEAEAEPVRQVHGF